MSFTFDIGTAGGRLTFQTGTPVMYAPFFNSTTVYYTPYTSGVISLYDGANWNLVGFNETTILMTNTQSCSSVASNPNLTVTDSSQLCAGMKISGSGIAANTVISSITNATTVVMNNAATGTGTNTLTFKCPANTGYDIYGTLVGGTLALRMAARGAINTPNGISYVNGVPFYGANLTWRLLGAVATTTTDGLIDWTYTGQTRYRLTNLKNTIYWQGSENFGVGTSTWYKPIGILNAVLDIAAGGGGSGTSDSVGTAGSGNGGGSSSFGGRFGANGGSGGGSVPWNSWGSFSPPPIALAADGTGSGAGFTVYPGAGGKGGYSTVGVSVESTITIPGTGTTPNAGLTYQGSPGGSGGRIIGVVDAQNLNATETVVVGTGGSGGSASAGFAATSETGEPGWVIVREIVAI